MDAKWVGEKNILIFFIILYGVSCNPVGFILIWKVFLCAQALGTAWVFSIYFVQEYNEIKEDKAKINYYGYSIAAMSFAMAIVCLANWCFFSICITCVVSLSHYSIYYVNTTSSPSVHLLSYQYHGRLTDKCHKDIFDIGNGLRNCKENISR